ncbi:helix-turn-helix transcriptional regulator [Niameybacter massiliensis]|uniref:helix-turn-helix transcriptional regulator n=1 Tax=Niameybacter massiliensis TaxID=1658108 RepID=UPI0006B4AF86|nr:helix-turn-helix transcriptional regulator [Niameybacter massiliensis]
MNQNEFTIALVKARKDRGLTQEQACFVIGVADTSTLSKWETGKEIPSERTVSKIVQAYEEPLLGYIYLHRCTELGRLILPPIIHTGLDNLALRFQKEYNDIRSVQMDMISIACDGQVNEDEEERWERVQKEVTELAGVSLPLIISSFGVRKKLLQGGNLERAYV